MIESSEKVVRIGVAEALADGEALAADGDVEEVEDAGGGDEGSGEEHEEDGPSPLDLSGRDARALLGHQGFLFGVSVGGGSR